MSRRSRTTVAAPLSGAGSEELAKMANPHSPVCRLCRREGVKLYLKGDKCLSERCPFTKRNATPPGQHGLSRRRRISEYGIQLRAKQRGRRIYGVRSEEHTSELQSLRHL